MSRRFPVSEISVAFQARELLSEAGGGREARLALPLPRAGEIFASDGALRSGQFCTLSPRHAWATPAPTWRGTRSVDVCSATLDNALNRTRITSRTIDRSLFNKRNRDCTHVAIRSARCSESARGAAWDRFRKFSSALVELPRRDGRGMVREGNVPPEIKISRRGAARGRT